MSLENLLDISKGGKKIGVSEERISSQTPILTQYFSFYREYPDIFVDFLKGPDSKFNLFFYQRVFLRAAMRHRQAYATFPRAYSKSFLAVLILMIRCILYPGAKLFITSGGKEQASGIAKEKVDELCNLIPGLKKEIDWRPGKGTKTGKDDVVYVFKNKSQLDIAAAKQSSRGKRKHGGLVEEVILVDGTLLNEIIIPMMNVARRAGNGEVDPAETLNKSQIYVTTAGWKGTFPYEKLIEILIRQVAYPDEAIVLGGTWRIPVMERLLDKNFVQDLKNDGTYNEASFSREYESEWSGDAENAFFSGEQFDKHRVLKQPENEYSGRSNKLAYYVLGVDVGRKGCQTEVVVLKVTPQAQGTSIKTLVNLFSFDEEHFEDQAIRIKQLYYRYKARMVVIDGNGLGIGLVDYMIKSQETEEGEHLPDFGVYNDTDGFYKKYRTQETEENSIYVIKANAPINTEAHSYVQTQMTNGKIRFLISERDAQVKLNEMRRGKEMTSNEKADYLRPFTLTTVLREQLLNLVESNDGVNIILKQSNRKIQKDKFSAFEYALYYIKQEEESKKKKKNRDLTKLMLYS